MRWSRYARAVPGVLAAVVVLAVAGVVVADRSPGQPPAPSPAPATASASRDTSTIQVGVSPATPTGLPSLGQSDPDVRIVSSNLLFDQGTAAITVATTKPTINWSVYDASGQQTAGGTVSISAGTGTVVLRMLGPGYYVISAGTGTHLLNGPHTAASFGVLSPLPPSALAPASPFGVGIHALSPVDQSAVADMAQVGIAHARFDLSWDAVEQRAGTYLFPTTYDTVIRTLSDDHIQPLPIVDYKNSLYDIGRTASSPSALSAFANYAKAIIDHYPDIGELEVYNEYNIPLFNNSRCGLTADCYLSLLRQTYEAVKSTHPQTTVVGGSTAGLPLDWLNRLLDIGGLSYMDAISVHPYGYPNPPEPSFSELAALQDEIRAHDDGRSIPIWVTETGWPTNIGPRGVSEAAQADYLIRAEAIALAHGVTEFYWYDLVDDGTNTALTNDNFGLIRAEKTGITALTPKPALVAQAVMIRQLAGLSYDGSDGLPAPSYSYKFGTVASTARVMWSAIPVTVLVSATGPVTVTTEYGVSSTYNLTSGERLRLPLSGQPVFVRGSISSVALD